MPKGTGVLCVEKALLFEAYRDLAVRPMGKESSDDTLLLRTLIAREPGVIHPAVKIINYARPDFWASLQHLFQRGPKFVDYYLNPEAAQFLAGDCPAASGRPGPIIRPGADPCFYLDQDGCAFRGGCPAIRAGKPFTAGFCDRPLHAPAVCGRVLCRYPLRHLVKNTQNLPFSVSTV